MENGYNTDILRQIRWTYGCCENFTSKKPIPLFVTPLKMGGSERNEYVQKRTSSMLLSIYGAEARNF